ncbi:hypothetical protein ASE78_17140 [Sphingomonas sp. Leaf25]|nr:hypothetical protein ASE78_17140 [Sphingomonas sp. Leaf25]
MGVRALLPILGAVPSTAQAQTAPEVHRPAVVEGLSAIDLFVQADLARTNGRPTDALLLYDALAKDPDPDIRAEARFRKAMLLVEQRRYADAATTLRVLLDERPDAPRVRLELARTLALLGDETGARRTLRQAQAAGLPDDVAAVVDQFARALRSARPIGGSFQIAVAPDSNINRATQARTLDTVIAPLTLSRDARAQSGLGIRLSGQGYARVPVTDALSIVPRASALGNVYRQAQFDDVSASGVVGLEWRRRGDRWSPSIGLTRRWYGGQPYARTGSIMLDWLHSIGRQAQLLVHGGAATTDYRRNPLQDGGLYDASIGFERAVTPRSGFGLTLSGYRQTARDPGYATIAVTPAASVWAERGRTTMFATTSIGRLEGDRRLFLFPERRREWLASSSAGATFRQLAVHGLAPMVRLTLERNWSSIGLYRYRRFAAEVGLSRAF